MTPREILERACISDVWAALGGGPLRHGRGRAFWRGGNGYNVSLDERRGLWFDHARGKGSGILELIETALGCDRRSAIEWLANHLGVQLDDRSMSAAARRRWRLRRVWAERETNNLTVWRRQRLDELRARRNRFWDAERRASGWARAAMHDPARADDPRWECVWLHALDDQRGDELDRELARVEHLGPAELEAELRSGKGMQP